MVSRMMSEFFIQPAAAHSRSSWNCIIWYVKPMPSSPMRLRWGTRTSSKWIWAVSDGIHARLLELAGDLD
jgi:hypothetical protein